MAEVKKISLKYVVLAFVIAVAFILLLSVDQRVNQPPEEELIAVCLLYTSDAADD